ncbi:MAG: rod shape-determining protein RodA [Alphaproteobacteria bacterium]|nr:rod shape-determining protein RodA [Alphaproteobacteria bacterium]
MGSTFGFHSSMSIWQKLRHLNWGLLALLTAIACLGFTALYSAAGGNLDPWASRQMMRFVFGVGVLITVALVDVRWWYRLSYPAYAIGFIMLIIVEAIGQINMGAQRWINLGFMQIQPSEIMKIVVVMALARYFHGASLQDMRRIFFLVPPALMILAPAGLVMLQPDLDTAGMIIIVGTALFFVAGLSLWIFGAAIAGVLALLPVAWHFMHDYQKRRIMTFMDPESDPLGAGYHISQSKIALGSGGVGGKGFLNGSQSHLNFLPEKQTDFIFTLWAEEWGLTGGVFMLALFGLVFAYGSWIALRCRHAYGRLLAFGIVTNFSIYVFINVAMVMGVIPVVGTPLPLVSYGGTAMLSVMIGFGLVMSCSIHRDSKLPRM